MYSLKNKTAKDFKNIPIDKTLQEEIIQRTGSALDLEKAFSIIRDASEDFNKSDPLAEQADELMIQLLEAKTPNTTIVVNKEKSETTTSKVLNKAAIRIRQKQRQRTLAILEMQQSLIKKTA